jgi:hypothetical protein
LSLCSKGFLCDKHSDKMEPLSLSLYRHIPQGAVWLVARAAKEFMLLQRQRENKAQRQRQKLQQQQKDQEEQNEEGEQKAQQLQPQQPQQPQYQAGSLVGRRVRIWWEDDEQYYEADVLRELPRESAAGGSADGAGGGTHRGGKTHTVCYVADNLEADEDLSVTEGLIVPWQMLSTKEEAEAVAKTKWAMSQALLQANASQSPQQPSPPPSQRKRKLPGGGLAAEFLEGNKWSQFVDEAPCALCGSSENETTILQCGDGKQVPPPTPHPCHDPFCHDPPSYTLLTRLLHASYTLLHASL